MKQLRISIPFVGGVTAIYEEEEVKQMKQKMSNGCKAIGHFFKNAGIVALVIAEPAVKGAAKFVDKTAAKVREHKAKAE